MPNPPIELGLGEPTKTEIDLAAGNLQQASEDALALLRRLQEEREQYRKAFNRLIATVARERADQAPQRTEAAWERIYFPEEARLRAIVNTLIPRFFP
jgi:hypothetical protein